ncbi:class I SAM-dependent methyltransferase [Streptomyces sp. NPDC046161]|uniref:class I SAM-dependent methyltransferase n=1 Tax=Streptomyces sp. NPDC046161 TaxID=3155132 RepID=UPI0033CE8187
MTSIHRDTKAGREVAFDRIADLYAKFAEITEQPYRQWVSRVVCSHGRRAVDLGCGGGQFLDILADRFAQVLAVDVSIRQLEIAQAKHGQGVITYSCRDIRDVTPDRDGRFDLVFSVTALHHVPDLDDTLVRIRNLVAPGGRVVVIDVVAHTPRWVNGTGALFHLWRRARALRGAGQALVHGYSLAHALAMFRLRVHPVWLELSAHAKPLTRVEFHSRYVRAFPGARIVDDLDPSVCAMVWDSPRM